MTPCRYEPGADVVGYLDGQGSIVRVAGKVDSGAMEAADGNRRTVAIPDKHATVRIPLPVHIAVPAALMFCDIRLRQDIPG